MSETLLKFKKLGVSVLFDVVKIEIICGDDYEAQVTYDDILDRLRRGEGLKLSFEQAPSNDDGTKTPPSA